MLGKILIISPSFAPQAFVGGVRTTLFAKYLTLMGWEVWVITRIIPTDDAVMDSGMNLDLPSDLKDRIIRIENPSEFDYIEKRSRSQKIRDFFWPEFSSPPGFLDLAVPIGLKLIDIHTFDFILASVPDQWGLTLGKILSKKGAKKFIVDFRDIYEQEKSEERSLQEKVHVLRMLWRRNIACKSADMITTVSQFHKRILERKLKKRTEVIYNGYEEEIFKPIFIQPQSTTFTISYLGRILGKWYHNPTVLFQALSELGRDNQISEKDLQINFYGVDRIKLSGYITTENEKFVQLLPRIDIEKVAGIMNESQALLLITNKGREGVLTTKFFEYAGVQKPILCIPGDGGELETVIESKQFGVTVDSVEEVKSYLIKSVEDFKSGDWPIIMDTEPGFFTRRNQTQALSDLLKSLVR